MSKLDRLFRPRSIAVIGGGSWCENVVDQCRKTGFSGSIWPVHPNKTKLAGLPVFSSISELPGMPDAAFIGVNRRVTIEIVRELSEIGAGGAVCFASGFLELEEGEGRKLQNELLDAARDMPIIGPNCYGFLNYLDGVALWPDQHGGLRQERGVAIITQSSNIAINLTMQMRGLPIAYLMTAGNQAQVNLAEIGQNLIEDPRVTALGLHIEGISDIRALERLAARAHEMNKPIVALKVGSSENAKAATITHTASLAGSDAGARALLARLGIGQVTSLAALIETLKLLHLEGPLASNAIASLSCSGGEAGLIADAIQSSKLVMPALSNQQNDTLRDVLGPSVTLTNPLDYQTRIWGDLTALTQTFIAMADPQYSLVVVMLDFPRLDRCSADDWELVTTAIAEAKKQTGIPFCVLGSLSENLSENVSVSLMEQGIVPLGGLSEAVEAINVAALLSEFVASPPVYLGDNVPELRVLNEGHAKRLLSKWGVRVPANGTALSPAEAAAKAAEIGFPVALKAMGIAHKTEAGAVKLHLTSNEQVQTTAEQMGGNEFLVEAMISDTVAELLVGIVRDSAHGFVLTVAAGGTFAELIQDSASLLVPASRDNIKTQLHQLKIWKLLVGYRGAPPADIEAIIDTIMAIQEFVQTGTVEEVEINPLLCGSNGAVAVDALIRIGGDHAE